MTSTELSGSRVTADVPSRFAALQQRFVEGLPARWAAIALTARGGKLQRAELHRLAGAGGSFGYGALGEAARAAECCSDADMEMALSKLQALVLMAISVNQVI